MNRSAKGGIRSSPHHRGEGILIHPPYQGDCGRHGAEEQRVTSGGLTESLGGARVSRPISESEMASDTRSVDGQLCSTTRPAKAVRPAMATGSGSGKAAGEDGGEEKGRQKSKGEKVEQFHE